jgi:transcriptional regulator with XRE-family HTH domain
MSSNRLDEVRDYAFADRALALRQRAGLTQGELAALMGAGVRSIQAWEAGLSYPGADRLQQVIAVYLEHGGFATGCELEDANALWDAARAHAPRRITPFDRRRFASLQRAASGVAFAVSGHQGWHELPDADYFYGRTDELQVLSRWLLEDRCRVVAVLGAGGIGKTLLTARLARTLAHSLGLCTGVACATRRR